MSFDELKMWNVAYGIAGGGDYDFDEDTWIEKEAS